MCSREKNPQAVKHQKMQLNWKQTTFAFCIAALVIGLQCGQMKKRCFFFFILIFFICLIIWCREWQDLAETWLMYPYLSKTCPLYDSSNFSQHTCHFLCFQFEYHTIYEMVTTFQVRFIELLVLLREKWFSIK